MNKSIIHNLIQASVQVYASLYPGQISMDRFIEPYARFIF